MENDYFTLMKNHTWDLVPPSAHRKLVKNKWIFRIKRCADGSILQYKAQLVAKGFHQSLRMDFFETFNLMAITSTIRVILSWAVSNRWVLRKSDFHNVFLNGDLMDEIYMSHPLASSTLNIQTRCVSYERLSTTSNRLSQLGMIPWNEPSSTGICQLIFQHHKSIILLLVYVNDVIITATTMVWFLSLFTSLMPLLP